MTGGSRYLPNFIVDRLNWGFDAIMRRRIGLAACQHHLQLHRRVRPRGDVLPRHSDGGPAGHQRGGRRPARPVVLGLGLLVAACCCIILVEFCLLGNIRESTSNTMTTTSKLYIDSRDNLSFPVRFQFFFAKPDATYIKSVSE